jgi:hypothetical protein
MRGVWSCPKRLPEGSQDAQLHEEGRFAELLLRPSRPQFNAISSIPNSVPLHMQLKDFMDEQAKINKDTVTKFKAIYKVLENIDSNVT